MRKRLYNVFLGVTFVSSLYGMKPPSPKLPHPLLMIPASVMHDCIQPYLSHQEVGRCRRMAKWGSQLFDGAYGCHRVGDKFCTTPACCILEKNFYACTKALAYFAQRHRKAQKSKADKEAEDCELLFQHLWCLHGSIRIKDPQLKKRFYIDHQMNLYRKRYLRPEAIARWIFEYSIKTVESDNGVICKRMLSGGPFNIFDIVSDYSADEMICVNKGIILLFGYACNNEDLEFIRALCGMNVDGRSLPYIMAISSEAFGLMLLERKFLLPDTTDAYGRQPLHFAARYGFKNVTTSLLLLGAYVNARDDQDRTPLHYAVKYRSVFSVQELLKHADVSVLLKDKSGNTVFDYAKRKRMLGSSSPEKRYNRVYIKNLIQAHMDSKIENATSSSGKLKYQKI